jgi:hypothetical protein
MEPHATTEDSVYSNINQTYNTLVSAAAESLAEGKAVPFLVCLQKGPRISLTGLLSLRSLFSRNIARNNKISSLLASYCANSFELKMKLCGQDFVAQPYAQFWRTLHHYVMYPFRPADIRGIKKSIPFEVLAIFPASTAA